MIRIFSIFSVFIFLVFNCKAEGDDKAQIHTAFENYRTAVMNSNGAEAIKYVDSKTVAYYGKILDLVKNADSATVSALPIMDKLSVLSIRSRSTKDEIRPLDGRGLLVYSVNKGMISKSSMQNNTIGDITINKNTAEGALLVKGNPTPFVIKFNKEGSAWKADLVSLTDLAAPVMKQMADGSGMSENEFVLALIEKVTGKTPGPEVWQKFGN